MGHSGGKFPVATQHHEKVVLFFRTESSKQKLVFHLFKAIFDSSFFMAVLLLMELVCTNGERGSRTKFTSPEFCTNQFVRVNGKQPLFCLINQLPLRRSRYRRSRYRRSRYVVTHHRDLGNGHYAISV